VDKPNGSTVHQIPTTLSGLSPACPAGGLSWQWSELNQQAPAAIQQTNALHDRPIVSPLAHNIFNRPKAPARPSNSYQQTSRPEQCGEI
jgi:hypothetical protein